MNIRTLPLFSSNRLALLAGLCFTVLWLAPSARAGLTLEMNVIRYHQYGYYFYPNVTTNSTGPAVPFGDYYFASLNAPTNGASVLYQFTTNGFNQVGGSIWGYGDFDTMVHELTNGLWALFVTNTVTTNVFHFRVTANITSNALPLVSITSPANGAVNVTNRPTFTWQGPTNYNNLTLYYASYSSTLSVTQTSLLSPVEFYQGIQYLTAHYDSNSTTAVVASVPTNNAAQPFSGWVSTMHFQDYVSSQFTVGTVDTSGTSHTLVAHYPWDAMNENSTASGADTSGHGYDMDFMGGFGGQGNTESTTEHAAGPRANRFHNGDGSSAGYVGWNLTPPALLNALAGSFSVSCWIKTTQTGGGWDQAPAYYGAGIISADNPDLANDVIPLALTGNTVGFNTGGSEDVTLNSVAYVNDGNYHHVVVTRNQATGQKIIYIDGVMDGFSSGTTNLLNDPLLLTIGALSDARDFDAPSTYYYNGYDGALDDLQIYSGVLSLTEVGQLYANPGTTADQVIAVPLVARYNFETTNDIFTAGTDSSGNNNNAGCASGNGGTNIDIFSTDAAVGTYAWEFRGDSSICFYPGSTTFDHLSNAFHGSFSLTAWVKTTNTVNSDYANAYFGAPIWFDYSSGTNSAILSITGSKAALTVGNPDGGDTTIHSTTTVNDGNYHLVVATRNQASGVVKIYVDGNLEATDLTSNAPVIPTGTMYLAGGWYASYLGLVDDVRVYGGELSAADVATLAGIPFIDFNAALNTTGLTWTTGGDFPWFVETTNTYDNVSAAQSGDIGDSGQTWIETTVIGPGTLSFWWKVASEEYYDYLEFLIDGGWQTDMSGDSGWQQQTYSIDPGPHTLRWNYYKDETDDDFLDAGFLDQVSYVPASLTPPVITLDPFSQTNRPGYSVALLAGATGDDPLTWQWHKAGPGAIPGATNALYVPTNAGTAGVAGDYFAVASNPGGSATSLTATVTFVSAASPPDWARAFRPQLDSYDSSFAVSNYGIACLVDASGNLYSANSFTGTNLFGTNTLISGPGRFAAALLKQTSTGTALWGRALTNDGNGNSYPQCVAPAPGDGVYMSGVFLGTNWLGTNRIVDTAGASIYLARFDASGSNLSIRTFGGTNACFQSYHQLAADAAGNVTISALIQNTVSFGSTNVTVAGQRGVLAQYDASGNLRWVQVPSGWFQALAYSGGRIYGAMDGHETNYAGGLTNTSDRHWVLAALNVTNGQAAWLRGYASDINSAVFGDSPKVAASGTNVFVVGLSGGSSATFGALSVSWSGGVGQYFARYDTNGNAQAASAFGSTTTMPFAVVADTSGNVYVGGDFDTYSRFGSNLIAAPFHESIGPGYPGQTFLAKLDRNGNALWARLAQSPTSFANLRDLAVVNDGVWGCGFLNQSASFGTNLVYGPLTCLGFPFCTLQFYVGGWLAKITDAATASPVTLLNPSGVGNGLSFRFLSQAGFTHTVEARANVDTGAWVALTNVPGDGTVKLIQLPGTNQPTRFFRVGTH